MRPPIAIPFTLDQAGFVTLVIEDAQGKRVRNLVSETPFPAGQNTAYWDGLDDLARDPAAYSRGVYHIPGRLVAPGKYLVRGLVRPQIDLRYQMTPYTEGDPPWETEDRRSGWLTNHTPPRAALFVPAGKAPRRQGLAASSGGQVLVGSSVAEGGSGLAWLDTDGRKLHGQMWLGGIWTGVQFLTRASGPRAPEGVYAYSAHAWEDELRLQELRSEPAAAANDRRLGTGDDLPVLSPTWKFPEGTPRLTDHGSEKGVGGMASHNGLVAVSLPVLNRLLFVDGLSRRAIGTVPLDRPGGLAFDAQGRLLALSGKKLLRFNLPADLRPYTQRAASPGGEALSKQGWKATASQNPEGAASTIDRSVATRWESRESQRPGMSLTIDMGSAQSFSRVVVESPWPPDWTRAYEISASMDGQSWGAPLAKGEGKPDTLSIEVPRTQARYLRVTQAGQANNWWAINEITLFDQEPAAASLAPRPLPAPQVFVASGLEEPQNLTLDSSGNIYVSDWGASHNVKLFSPQGKYLRSVGKPGKPKAGPYDPAKMHHPVGLTLDDQGRMWVAEEDFQPKRLSIWEAKTGKFLRAFYGPQRYGGGGEIDPRDKTAYYYDGIQFKLDYASQKSRPVSVFYRPEPGEVTAGGDSVAAYMPQTPVFANNRRYLTNAYNVGPTNGAPYAGLWLMTSGSVARPVAMAGQANDYAFFRDLVGQGQNFSARWTGFVTAPTTGEYTISTLSDDGVRLWVGNQKLIDNWTPHGTTEDMGTIRLEAGRAYPIRLEYFQGDGGGTIRLRWAREGGALDPVPSSVLRPGANAKSNGLKAEYFTGRDLKELKVTRVDANIDFGNPLLPGAPSKAGFASRLPAGANPGLSAHDNSVFFFWRDSDGDARMQPGEVTFRKLESGRVEGVVVMSDASFVINNHGGQSVRFAPQSFDQKGVPRYDIGRGQVVASGVQHPTTTGGGQSLPGKGGWTMVYPAPRPFEPYGLGGVKDGVPMWSYPSLWPGLHASHGAPRPRLPGEMIGTTRLLGPPFEPGKGTGQMFALNGNMGNFYLMTMDGLFVATLFHDIRLKPVWSFPRAQKELLLNETSLHDESFWPFITQTSDGKIYASVNGSIVRVDGLEKVRRLSSSTLNVTAAMLEDAGRYFVQREAQRQAHEAQSAAPLVVALRAQAPVLDGKLDDWASAKWAVVDRKWVGGLGGWGNEQTSVEAAVAVSGERLFAAFKTDDANLLANKPESLSTLFKSGGALDLMLGNVEGAQRLLVSRVDGKTTAMLYRPRDPEAGGEATRFVSNIGTLKTLSFDLVRDVSAQVRLAQDGSNYELSVPLELLKLAPQPGQEIKGDMGVLRGNGFQTTQRTYWRNKATGLTSDLASEAELTPQLWGTWQFAPAS
jgi:hypothetical protein